MIADHDEITRAVGLLVEPSSVVELRAPGSRRGTLSGYFDSPAALVEAAAQLNGGAPGVYVTINPVRPALLARASNRIEPYAKHTTGDADILARRWLLLDFDPIRPSGISATDAEHITALEAARACARWLIATVSIARGSLVFADSGNGAHILIRSDLPNTSATTTLVRRCLDAAALYCSTDTVQLDTSVHNAARIGKLYGTIAAKGDATPERPHRLARILHAPRDGAVPVPLAALERLAALRPEEPPRTSSRLRRDDFDVRWWLAQHGITVIREKPWNGSTVLELAACPIGDHEHHRNEAVIVVCASGMLLYRCLHQTCADRQWSHLREHFDGPRHQRAGGFGDSGDFGTRHDADTAEWPALDRTILDPHREPAPELPLEVFPSPWPAWITAAAGVKSCPPDYVASGTLSCASALIANARWGSPWPGWSEPPVLWHGGVGLPSSGKSPGLDAAREPLETLERDANVDRPERVRTWEVDVAVAALRRKVWEAECLRALKAGEPIPDGAGDTVPPDRPRYRRLVTSDATVEKVARLLVDNPKGLLLFRDELAGWLGAMDKYGGAGSDRAFYLESYGGRRYAVDRVKDAEPIIVPALSLAVLGGIQPDRLSSLLLSGDDDGLAARFLWTWPEPVPPRRPDRPVPDGVAAAFGRLHALAIPEGREHGVVAFCEAAASVIQEWRTETAALEPEAAGLYLSWCGKLPGMAVRLAVVLEHLAWCTTDGQLPETISERSAVAAVTYLSTYAVPMAKRCFGDASWPQADRDARRLALWLLAQQPVPEAVNLREIRRWHAPLGREALRYDAAAAELIVAGWLRHPPREPGPGRRAKTLLVNPALRGQS